jgi:hypothetical protein
LVYNKYSKARHVRALLFYRAAVEVNYGSIGSTLRNAADIKNLFVHEYGGHITDMMSNPSISGRKYELEGSATLLSNESFKWRNISPEFKQHIRTYQGKYLKDDQLNKYFKR